jgi:hypothetical protein
MKKIFLLELTNSDLIGYDCYLGHVVVADNETEARKLVDENFNGDEKMLQKDCWLNKRHSSCNELLLDKSCVVLSDYNAG